jgi:hypothetical protein
MPNFINKNQLYELIFENILWVKFRIYAVVQSLLRSNDFYTQGDFILYNKLFKL